MPQFLIRQAVAVTVNVKKASKAPRTIAPSTLVAAKVTANKIADNKIVPKIPAIKALSDEQQ